MKTIAHPFVVFTEKHGQHLRRKVSFECVQEAFVKLPEFAGASIRRNPRFPVLGVTLTFAAFLDVAPAVASSEFASGPFTLPEVITAGLNGTYLLSDADNDEIYSIPANGGPATIGTPMGFRVFGEIALPSGYAQSGQYLAYGTDSSSTLGVAALTGTSGLGGPVQVISTSNSWFANAVVAPENFGTIAKGQVILSNQSAAVNSAIPSTIDILNNNGTSLSTFASLPKGVDAYGIGFAPESFGANGGDLFVTDSGSGNYMRSTLRATPHCSRIFLYHLGSLILV